MYRHGVSMYTDFNSRAWNPLFSFESSDKYPSFLYRISLFETPTF